MSLLVGVATSEEHIAERGPEAYGFPTKVHGLDHLQLVRLSYNGIPEITLEVKCCELERARTLRYCKRSFGMEENTYPKPEGITHSPK